MTRSLPMEAVSLNSDFASPMMQEFSISSRVV
jgi:hypothetical protein